MNDQSGGPGQGRPPGQSIAVYGFAETEPQARALAEMLGVGYETVEVRHFPDRESLVRVPAPAAPAALVFRSLDDPNGKLIELMLASSALRANGARQIALIAPYLAYMRQDTAFHPGEAVSQRIVGRFLAGLFEEIFTVEPHLHRTSDLGEVFAPARARALPGTPLLAELLAGDARPETVLVGPDAESRAWVERLAEPLGLDFTVAEKERRGDRDVSVRLDDPATVKGRPAILVDDVVSTGRTMIEAAKALREAGAASIEALSVHCLAGPDDMAALEAAGIARLRSTDSVPHASNAAQVAPLIARALAEAADDSQQN